jgi:hypothetical protein
VRIVVKSSIRPTVSKATRVKKREEDPTLISEFMTVVIADSAQDALKLLMRTKHMTVHSLLLVTQHQLYVAVVTKFFLNLPSTATWRSIVETTGFAKFVTKNLRQIELLTVKNEFTCS